MEGKCKLCKNEAKLEKSHFVPKFIGKYLKKTSITGYLREKNQVQKRVQDLPKEYWLCGECEDIFSTWEALFSQKIFYPYIDNPSERLQYGNWLSKFVASISWRTLTYIRSKNSDDEANHTDEYIKCLDSAELGLSNYLQGKTDNLFEFEQHIYPVGAIASHTIENNMPKNINRYFLRTVAMDIVGNKEEIYVFTKIPSFIFLGVVKSKLSKVIRSSRISIRGDVLSPREYIFPAGVGEYMFEKAEEINKAYDGIPDDQHRKIHNYMMENKDKVLKSKLFEAIKHDVEQFGKGALK